MQFSKPTTFILGLFCGVIAIVLAGVTAMRQGYLKADILSSDVEVEVTQEAESSQYPERPCGYLYTDGQPSLCGGSCFDEGQVCDVKPTNNPYDPDERTCGCWTISQPCETTLNCKKESELEGFQCLTNACFNGTCDLISICDEGEVCDARGHCIDEEELSSSSIETPGPLL